MLHRYKEIFEMDPNQLSANGGMLETGECGSFNSRGFRYDRTVIDGLKLPDNDQQRFIAVGDGGIDGHGANELLIYRRTRVGVHIADVLGSKGARAAASGPRIGAAQTTADGRELTGLEYAQDADPENPIFRVKLINRELAAKMLGGVPPTWSC